MTTLEELIKQDQFAFEQMALMRGHKLFEFYKKIWIGLDGELRKAKIAAKKAAKSQSQDTEPALPLETADTVAANAATSPQQAPDPLAGEVTPFDVYSQPDLQPVGRIRPLPSSAQRTTAKNK